MSQPSASGLDALLSIYTFDFFAKGTRNEELCRAVLDDVVTKEKVAASMRILLPPSVDAAADVVRIQDSLQYRIPVYFGRICSDMFKDAALKKVCGYKAKEGLAKIDPSIRYAICGRVLATSKSVAKPKYAYVSNVWGVNFETRDTWDYKHYTTGAGRIRRKLYQQTQDEMANLIVQSGIHAMQDSGANTCDLLVPMIGMGAFLTSIENEADRKWAVETLVGSLWKHAQHAARAHPGLNVIFYSSRAAYLRASHTSSNFTISEGDMFADAGRLLKTSACLCAINAYDPVSMVGNSGSVDFTIDGMFASGCVVGKTFANSCYTHNTFLMPVVLKPSSWISLSANESESEMEANEEQAPSAASAAAAAASAAPSSKKKRKAKKSPASSSNNENRGSNSNSDNNNKSNNNHVNASSSKKKKSGSKKKAWSSKKKQKHKASILSDAEEDDAAAVPAVLPKDGLVMIRASHGMYLAPGPVSALPAKWRFDGVVGCVISQEVPYAWRVHNGTHLVTSEEGHAWEVYMDADDTTAVDYILLWRRLNKSTKQTFDIQSSTISYGDDLNVYIAPNLLARLSQTKQTPLRIQPASDATEDATLHASSKKNKNQNKNKHASQGASAATAAAAPSSSSSNGGLLFWKEPPAVLPCSMFYMSKAQAKIVAKYPELKPYVIHLPCWISQDVMADAVYKNLKNLRLAEAVHGHFLWATEFANCHSTWKNFKEDAIVIDGYTYHGGSETYYQLMKSKGTSDHAKALKDVEKRGARLDPLESWEIGQKYAVRKGWDGMKEKVMEKPVTIKFTQNHSLTHLLLSTGKHPLVQLKPDDGFWGTGAHGDGDNVLGVMLEKLRQKLSLSE